MFLKKLCKRNSDFVLSVLNLHQNGKLKPNTYVLDFDTIARNLQYIKSEADRLNLTVYPMTKQIGRNPFILEYLKESHFGKVVTVDWMEAQQVSANGVDIGHVGHLVQIPITETKSITDLNPEVWTVFSYEKAVEINQVLAGTNQNNKSYYEYGKMGMFFIKVMRVV